MGFSSEWEDIYKSGRHLSVWPWSDLVGLVRQHVPDIGPGSRVLEIGCGAGANVPFFNELGVDYFGVDGSPTMVAQLQDRFDDMANHFHACDFTDTLYFEGPFDLLIDRGSLTHNSDADIRKTVNLAYDALHSGGKLISVDCCSDQHYGFTAGDPGEDPYTRINFTDGALAGTGKVHFSDSSNIRDIFSDWSIEYMAHKSLDPIVPKEPFKLIFWDFVAVKP